MKLFVRLLELVLVVVTGSSLFGQFPDCAVVARWGDRTETRDAVLSEGFLVTADGAGVTLFDISNPAAPIVRSQFATPTPSIAIERLSDGRLAVLTESELLLLRVDLSGMLNAETRRLISGRKLAAFGSSIAVAAERSVTFFPDIDVLSAVELTAVGIVDAIHLDAKHLYFAERGSGIRIVLRATGADVSRLSVSAIDLTSRDGFVYAAAAGLGIFVIDATRSNDPRLVTLLEPAVADFRRVYIHENSLFALSSAGELRKFSIASPEAPAFLASTTVSAADLLFLSSTETLGWSRFVTAVGVTRTESAPLSLFRDFKLVRNLRDASVFSGVALDGRYAFVTDAPDLRILDLDSATGPREVASIHYGDASTEVRLEGTLLLVFGISNVHMIDVSKPASPRYLGVYRALGAPPSGAAMAGRYLLEANKPTGFHVVDISNPAKPVQITGLKNDGLGQVYGTVGVEGAAYNLIAAGIKVVDLSRGVAEVTQVILATNSIVDADIVASSEAEPRLLALTDGNVLRLFDINDRLRASETAKLDIGHSGKIAVDRHLIYVLSVDGKLTRVDATIAENPVVTNRWEGLRAATGIAARGRIVLTGRYEVLVIEDPAAKAATSPDLQPATIGGIRYARLGGDPSRYYEVEIAQSAAGERGRNIVVRGGSDIELFPRERYARARAQSRCADERGSWVELFQPAAEVRFSGDESRIVALAGSSISVEIGVTNDSSASQDVTISGPGFSSIAATIPASRTTLVSIPLIVNTDEVRILTLRSGSMVDDHRLRITAVSRQAGSMFENGSFIIPGIGTTAGAGGSRWKSDLTIHCSGTSGCSSVIRYVASGVREQFVLEMSGGEVLTIVDIVSRLFERSSSTGHLEVVTTRGEVATEAFTYNEGAGGRFGQRVTAERSTSAPSQLVHLVGLRSDATTRTNIGIVSTAAETRVLTMRLLDAGGRTLSTRTFDAPANSDLLLPLTSLFAEAAGLVNGSMEVSGDDGVVLYASRVEASTGDAIFNVASSPIEAPVLGLFDVVGSIELPESSWRTELVLKNAAAEATRVDFALFHANASDRETATIQIAPGATWSSVDVMRELFGRTEGMMLGALHVISEGRIVGWGRLYHTTRTGVYAQELPLRNLQRESSRGVSISPVVELFPIEESAAIRTNIGLHETTGAAVKLELRLLDSSGGVIAVETLELQPYSTLFISAYASRSGWQGRDARLRIVPVGGSGVVTAWASRVDRVSGDARTIGVR